MRTIEAVRRSGVGIGPEQTIRDAARIMEEAGIGALAVIEASRRYRDRPRPCAPRTGPRPSRRRQGRRGHELAGDHHRRRRRSTRHIRPVSNARGSPTGARSGRPVRRHDHRRRPADRPGRRPVRPRQASDRRSDIRPPRQLVAGHDQRVSGGPSTRPMPTPASLPATGLFTIARDVDRIDAPRFGCERCDHGPPGRLVAARAIAFRTIPEPNRPTTAQPMRVSPGTQPRRSATLPAVIPRVHNVP